MELKEMQELARFVKNNSVNCQLELSLDWDGAVLFCIRITPWRNSYNPNRMILVADYYLEQAFVTTVAELEASRWLPLDWKARPIEAGVYQPDYGNTPTLLERTQQLRRRAEQLERNGHSPTGPTDSGA